MKLSSRLTLVHVLQKACRLPGRPAHGVIGEPGIVRLNLVEAESQMTARISLSHEDGRGAAVGKGLFDGKD